MATILIFIGAAVDACGVTAGVNLATIAPFSSFFGLAARKDQPHHLPQHALHTIPFSPSHPWFCIRVCVQRV